MKRFVTYLYEYDRGNKSKNMGFIRVNIRNEKTELQVVIRNCLRTNEVGKIFALIDKEKLQGIELGEIKIINGQSDGRITFATNNIMDSGYSLNEIAGIGIRLQSQEYFASCWKDEFAKEIAHGEFLLENNLEEIQEVQEVFLAAAEEKHELENQMSHRQENQMPYRQENKPWETETERAVSYEKIDLAQIRDLPSPNWHLCNNSFLVHGFWNYGYLVLKKEMEKDKEKLSLGIPGIFEKPEMVMAVVFGFSDFEALPSEMVEVEMNVEKCFPHQEKNQEPKVGLFGCWFVDLKD